MASQLGIYNSALMKLGSPRILTLTDNVPSRKTIDAIYTAAVEFCLEQAVWDWAVRSVQIDASTDVEPAFGYNNAFEQPDDMKKLVAISSESTLRNPLEDFLDEGGYWFADSDPIYLSYVSTSVLYGWNLGAWTEAFADMVAFRIAIVTCETITQSTAKLVDLKRDFKTARSNAIAINNFDDAPKRFPQGSFTRARQGGWRSSRRPER